MNFFERFRFVGGAERAVLSALFGRERCVRCGAGAGLVPLCQNCSEELQNYVPLVSPFRCSMCGKILISESGLCMECRERSGESSLDALFPVHSYREWKKELAFAWKSEGRRRLSSPLARLLFTALSELGFQKMPVVPVPPRPGKIKEAGWDQVEELSRILEKECGVFVRRDFLVRLPGGQQKKLSRGERLGALGAAYALRPKWTEERKAPGGAEGVPQEAVLLDDIVTTGATMEKCAWLLKKAGVKKVWGLALFRVD